jgi:hypothetical protein
MWTKFLALSSVLLQEVILHKQRLLPQINHFLAWQSLAYNPWIVSKRSDD